MIKYSKTHKFISVLIIFNLLIQISGCVSTSVISASDFPVSGEFNYRVNGQKSSFLLENAVISNRILSGKINYSKSTQIARVVNLYLSSDSVIKLDTGQILSIPVDSIVKVEKTVFSPAKTILLVGSIFTTIVVIMLSSPMGGMPPLMNGI
jgi:hypothetical protein